MAQLENLLLMLARSLVEDPERVEVSGTETDSRVDLELRVAPEDMGKIIGRGGRTIRAHLRACRSSHSWTSWRGGCRRKHSSASLC